MNDPKMLELSDGTPITNPDWSEVETPSPTEWLDWFLAQSREAQLRIGDYMLAMDKAASLLIEAFQDAIGELEREEMPAPAAIGALFGVYYRLDPRVIEANHD